MWSVLLCRLRPARRHAGQLTTVLGSNNLIRSRRYSFSSFNGDTRRDTKKQDLYVVLDDHKDDGFGIHKLDLRFTVDDLYGGMRSLPEPPIIRVSLQTLGSRVQFAAVGSSIVAIGTPLISPELNTCYIPDIGGILIYNTKTKTGGITVAPYLPTLLMRPGHKAAVAIGNSLYMLGCKPLLHKWKSSLYCLTADPVDKDRDNFWGWDPLSASSKWCWSSFQKPPILPFFAKHVTAHAVQAQHEILVSVRPSKTKVLGSIFSFSTESNKWRQLGAWHLPVAGQAHYDVEMDAWVGLHAVNGNNMYGSVVMDGHLCVGKLTSSLSEWKVSKEKLFRLQEDVRAGWRHVSAKLVSRVLGNGGNQYCLMECLCTKEEEESEEEEEEEDKTESHHFNDKEEVWGEGSKCLVRLAIFRLKGGQDAEPVVTARWPVRYYQVSRHNRHFDAQVFWM